MARIDTYRAQRTLQAPGTPQVNLSSAVSQELEGLGATTQDAAATFIQRIEERENFKAENARRKLDLELADELERRAQEIPEGGEGFHQTFMTEVFQPKRDEFLASLPARLRPQFEPLFSNEEGAEYTKWSIAGARAERDENYRWQKQEIAATHEQLAAAVAMRPEEYDAYLEDGLSLIESSSLPTPEKALLKQTWEHMAQVAHLNQMLLDDPEGVLRELGMDARNLSPTTQFSMLSRAVQWQESRDNPDAISPKGAVGLMQVMPATAADIARDLGDVDFPHGAPEGAVRAYLSNPHVNKMYGEEYLRQMLRKYAGARDPIEAALVAYNGGPGRADKWIESGYNDAVLPRETRKYKDVIMASMRSPVAESAPENVRFEMRGGGEPDVNPELRGRTASAFAALGLDKVRVNSDRRTKEENIAAGGADESEHLTGNALDIDVTNMPIRDRIELLKALSGAGVTGLGIYPNSIHVDLGGRRAWGPDHGSGSVPKWAAGIVKEHLNGTAPAPRRINARYAGLPYDDIIQFRSKADQAISAHESAANRASAVEKVEIRQQRDNELAMIRATGSGSEGFDATRISTILGEDDYIDFMHDAGVAAKTYTATQDIATMAPEAMEQRFEDYTPIAGAPDFADQQQIQAAVQKEIQRVQQLRANSPDEAALEFPQVKAEYDALMAAGGPETDGAATQRFVQTMLNTQADFGIAPEAQAPVPRTWALQIGKLLAQVTPDDRATAGINELTVALAQRYQLLEKAFGPMTDEVMIYALSEYKGVSKDMAKILSGYLTGLGANRGPLWRELNPDRAADVEQVESFGQPIYIPTPFGVLGPFGLPPASEGRSAEEQLRLEEAEEE